MSAASQNKCGRRSCGARAGYLAYSMTLVSRIMFTLI